MSDYEQDMEARWRRLEERLGGTDMSHIPAEVLHLARAVAGVEDPVMTCETCQEWLPTYVDDEISGLDVATLHPDVKRHLDLCADCAPEYLEMLDWGLAEEAGWQSAPASVAANDTAWAPAAASAPMPDLSFLPPIKKVSLLDYVRSLAEEVILSVAPKRKREFQTMADMFFKRLSQSGPSYRFQATPVLSGEPNAIQFMVTTYQTTQKLAEWSDWEIETKTRRGTLRESVRERAEEEARRQGFRKENAQLFAEQYAEIVCQDPTILQNLSD